MDWLNVLLAFTTIAFAWMWARAKLALAEERQEWQGLKNLAYKKYSEEFARILQELGVMAIPTYSKGCGDHIQIIPPNDPTAKPAGIIFEWWADPPHLNIVFPPQWKLANEYAISLVSAGYPPHRPGPSAEFVKKQILPLLS